jgi:hypothetical protein
MSFASSWHSFIRCNYLAAKLNGILDLEGPDEAQKRKRQDDCSSNIFLWLAPSLDLVLACTILGIPKDYVQLIKSVSYLVG